MAWVNWLQLKTIHVYFPFIKIHLKECYGVCNVVVFRT